MNMQEAAFKLFDKMKTSDVIIIKEFAKNDPEAFTQYARDYIDNGGSIEFNENYSKIRKLTPWADLMEFDKQLKS